MTMLLTRFFKAAGNKKYIPGIAWFLLTLIAISIPGKELPKFGPWFEQISFDKLIHTFLFGMLALLWVLPVVLHTHSTKQKLQWVTKVCIATAIWGLCTELIQKYLIPNRSYDIVDLVADALGAIFVYIYFVIRLRKPPKT